MTKDEALRLALEALKNSWTEPNNEQYEIEKEAIVAIKAALEAKDEPVAWLHRFIEGGISIGLKPSDLERHPERWEPLYTTPPQRKPLTDEEITEIFSTTKGLDFYLNFARAIEAAHGIKEEA